MLVYKKKDLPPDPVHPTDLEKLGFFINDQDQIRQIANAEEGFKFKINANERWNDVRGNSFNECIQRIVTSRLQEVGLSTLRLPLGSQPKDKHVPILVSPNLRTASRITLILGSPDQELGIWTYRSIAEQSINKGSMVEIAREILTNKPDTALIIANMGQLVYHCGSGRAMSQGTWFALPVETAAHPPPRQTWRNLIPRNTNWREHAKCIFEDVLAPESKMVNPEAKIDIIGVEEGGLGAVEYLVENWKSWNSSISGICFSRPQHHKHHLGVEDELSASDDITVPETGSFAHFISTRSRAYVLSDEPLQWPVPGTLEHGCNTYSGNEPVNHEDVIVSSWKSMLQWFDKVYADPAYEEAEFVIEETVEDDEGWEKWRRGEVDAIDDMQKLAVTDELES
ncbi:hypothetical protein TMatcc_000692 [Talaromyces marneffei ATCC 18224]|uniref:Arb2 domain-containing protein n=3 Tax=Talaromyces marneffei TaxID=37727 RepID=B6QQS9_TALMQ|nr:uncharacterized protein EYB26_003252 [Talaromyces marneffei]EEA20704.1 conserved hypothetical protein [Talaromyces marneffei ATCC 18224]KAE8549668.1 hypothetical protein EYB25_008191 [Talaromyces marneffei]QGA15593.1 hypothetical protein EYB26_003252 [Talaromyces marneffei]